METAGYTTLTRQAGLLKEVSLVANNIANAATTGYRQEGLIFSEYIRRTEGGPSLSMARGDIRRTSMMQGGLTPTGGKLDFAIEGEGFFAVETPAGQRLTRAGNFSVSAAGEMVTHDGHRVLDTGGAPVFVPPDAGGFHVAADGTISANGQPIGQIGVLRPVDGTPLIREDGVMFRPDGPTEPAPGGRIVQGFLEGSNVDPIGQFARLIEAQRAYEMGQSFLDAENARLREALKTFVR